MAGLSFDDLTTQKQKKAISFDDLTQPIVKKQAEKQGVLRTIADQGAQGATFGFADEAIDSVGRTLAQAYVGLSPSLNIKDIPSFKDVRSTSKEALAQQFEQRPVLSIGSNILGGIATSGPAAFTKTGARIGNMLRSGGAAARIGKGALAGAATGAAYGAGTSQDGERLRGAGSGALTGALIGGAVPAVGSAISKVTAKAPVSINSEQLRQIGGDAFKKADDMGGVMKPDLVENFIQKLSTKTPQTEIGKAIEGESAFSGMLERLQPLRGKPLTLQAAQEADSLLGDAAYKTLDKFGKVTNEGRLYLDAQNTLRNMIENATPDQLVNKEAFDTVKEARKFWSASLRMRDIERIIDNSQYFEQPSTAIRTGFRQMLKNKDRIKGFSKDEVKALKQAATTGVVTDLFRLGGSGLGPIISGSVGAGVAGPLGAAAALPVYAVRTASRGIADSRQMGRAKDAAMAIQRTIEKTTGKTAEDMLKIIEKGGNISREAIDALPQSEKKNFLSRIMQLPVAQARRILSNSNQDVTK